MYWAVLEGRFDRRDAAPLTRPSPGFRFRRGLRKQTD
jgi:hypothetical protein